MKNDKDIKFLTKEPFKLQNKYLKEKEIITKIIDKVSKKTIASELKDALQLEFEKLLLKTKDPVQLWIRGQVFEDEKFDAVASAFKLKAEEAGYNNHIIKENHDCVIDGITYNTDISSNATFKKNDNNRVALFGVKVGDLVRYQDFGGEGKGNITSIGKNGITVDDGSGVERELILKYDKQDDTKVYAYLKLNENKNTENNMNKECKCNGNCVCSTTKETNEKVMKTYNGVLAFSFISAEDVDGAKEEIEGEFDKLKFIFNKEITMIEGVNENLIDGTHLQKSTVVPGRKKQKGLVVTFTGRKDDWGRKLYKGNNGNMYADVDGIIHELTASGEPNVPVSAKIIEPKATPSNMNRAMKITKMAEDLLEEAQSAFWAVVANKYPNAPGDFTPEQTITFDNACRIAISQWINNNVDVDAITEKKINKVVNEGIYHLQSNYDDFAEFEYYNDMYNLAERLGFESAQEAWDKNPKVNVTTNVEEFKIVPEDTPVTEHKQEMMYKNAFQMFEPGEITEEKEYNDTSLKNLIESDAFLKFSYATLSTGDDEKDLDMIYNNYVKGDDAMKSKLKQFESYTFSILEKFNKSRQLNSSILETLKQYDIQINEGILSDVVNKISTALSGLKSKAIQVYQMATSDVKAELKRVFSGMSLKEIADKINAAGITSTEVKAVTENNEGEGNLKPNSELTLTEKIIKAFSLSAAAAGVVAIILSIALPEVFKINYIGNMPTSYLFGIGGATLLLSALGIVSVTQD